MGMLTAVLSAMSNDDHLRHSLMVLTPHPLLQILESSKAIILNPLLLLHSQIWKLLWIMLQSPSMHVLRHSGPPLHSSYLCWRHGYFSWKFYRCLCDELDSFWPRLGSLRVDPWKKQLGWRVLGWVLTHCDAGHCLKGWEQTRLQEWFMRIWGDKRHPYKPAWLTSWS